jgi:uncharacterized protein (DUF58 family)
MERKLNVNFAKAIAELESAFRQFILKKEVYTRVFRGKGLEFDGYRDFAPDDDASMIDWKATMRAGSKLLCKQYIEERDLRILFIVDVSDNMVFGSGEKLKCERVAEMVVALSHILLGAGDRVGLLLFSDRIKKIILPDAGRDQFEAIANNLSDPYLYGGESKLKETVFFSLRYFPKPPDAIFIVSDFIRIKRDAGELFSFLGRGSDTVALVIRDPVDETLPKISGEIAIEDAYTKKQVVINPKKIKELYEKYALEQRKLVEHTLMASGLDYLLMKTNKSFTQPLVTFFVERLKKKKHIATK